jgi:hypothetical protein
LLLHFNSFIDTTKALPKKYTKTTKKITQTNKYVPDKEIALDDKIFEKTLNYNSYTSNPYAVTPTTRLEDIKNEVKNIEMKIDNQVESTSSHYTRMMPQRIYVPPHIQADMKPPINDVKIHTKLTRVAKFPLSQLVKPDLIEKTEQIVDAVDKVNIKRDTKTSKLAELSSTGNRLASESFDEQRLDYKPYPDYFNDLLMWHSDVLNTDRVTSPFWDILQQIQDTPVTTTQSMTDMQKELMQINDFIRLNEETTVGKAKAPLKVKKDKIRSNGKWNEMIKTVAVKDNTIAKSNNIIVKGEAKYLHVYRDPSYYNKYSKASGLMSDLNKIYFKSPSIKYDIDNKLREAKRHGDFWLNELGKF